MLPFDDTLVTSNNHIMTNASHYPIDIRGMEAINLVREAIQSKKCVSIQYGGHKRIVEVHAMGITKRGHPVARGWQISGGSNGSGQSGWKLFRLDRGKQISLLNQGSKAPREGYVHNDRTIDLILAQI